MSKTRSFMMLVALAAAATLITACESLTAREKGALAGAALGSGTGAIIGHQSGHAGTGAAIGGVAGALGGGLIGHAIESNKPKPQEQPYYGGQAPPQPQGQWVWNNAYQRWEWVPYGQAYGQPTYNPSNAPPPLPPGGQQPYQQQPTYGSPYNP